MTVTPDIILSGEKIPWLQFLLHLGHVLTSSLSEVVDIRDKLSCFYGQTNYFLAKFKCVTLDICAKLFKCYCSCFYWAELRIYDDGYLYKISVAWREAVRLLWDLPYRIHYNLLPCTFNGLAIENAILLLAIKIYKFMSNSRK